jgi:two-component system, NtrC family, sensor histidine kinase KinB
MDEIEKLKKEIEQLKEINERKSDIISITSHKLRTSISALKWILKMFIDEDTGKLNPEQKELIKKAYISNERILAMVNDLLTLSHIKDIATTYNFQKIDLLSLLDKILFEFYEETIIKEVEVILIKPEIPLPFVICDEEMIHVVIQNLIENSIKYSNRGGKVFISIKQIENNIQLSICDNGIGINEKDKENIFKKFFRAPNAIEKDIIGSGLGLFVTKSIVEKHNGKIWFENTENGKTTFFVTLPIKQII